MLTLWSVPRPSRYLQALWEVRPVHDRLCERAGVVASNAWGKDEFFRLWAAADEELGDAEAGLCFGSEGIAQGYGVAAIVAPHAPDFGWALAALSRYKRLTSSELVEVEVSADAAAVRYPWLQTTREVPRVLVDTVMVSLRELAREGTAGRVAPVRRLAGRLVIRTKRSLRLAGAW